MSIKNLNKTEFNHLYSQIWQERYKNKSNIEIMEYLELSREDWLFYEQECNKRSKIAQDNHLKYLLNKWPNNKFFYLEDKIEKFKNKKGADFPIKDFYAKDVIEIYGETTECYLSGLPIDFTNPQTYSLDHFIAPCNGGNNELENLRPCNQIINIMKHTFSSGLFIKMCQGVSEYNIF